MTPTFGFRSRTDAILALLGSGLTDHEIAEKLGICPGVVRAHIRSRERARDRARPFQYLFPLDRDLLAKVAEAAAGRDLTVNQLVREIIHAVVVDGLIDAVLDTGGDKT